MEPLVRKTPLDKQRMRLRGSGRNKRQRKHVG